MPQIFWGRDRECPIPRIDWNNSKSAAFKLNEMDSDVVKLASEPLIACVPECFAFRENANRTFAQPRSLLCGALQEEPYQNRRLFSRSDLVPVVYQLHHAIDYFAGLGPRH
jgi:hypothetical protein